MKIFILEDNQSRIDFFINSMPDDDLTICTNVNDAKKTLKNHRFEFLFLDHDLGGKVFVDSGEYETGTTVTKFIIEANLLKDAIYVVHSQNPVGAKHMVNILKDSGRKAFIKPFTALYCEKDGNNNITK